ncbi:selenocysteine insertion sequence-binding protein 2 isoform X2 [Cynoglossus semilaevis]|nr:selenocysteine insertion sequence-binding protein 2 isoform X2 [Cynoglossus semilaevis]
MTRREAGDTVMSQSFNARLSVGEHRDEFLQRNRSTTKATKFSREQRAVVRNTTSTQKTGSGVARPAGTSKPALDNWIPFEVNMSDFPQLSDVPVPCASTTPILDQKEYSGKSMRRSQTPPGKSPNNSKTHPPEILPGQTIVSSWANVASQPPKKPVSQEKTVSSTFQKHGEKQQHFQKEDTTVTQENATAGKKKRRKKKKKNKMAVDEEEEESDIVVIHQKPPKFEDEEEFPGLGPVVQRSAAAKENHMAGKQLEQSKDRSSVSLEIVKKAQKTEKVSGKKSKVPVQLDIGNMLEVLEKKQQQSHKDKPVVLSVGGGLPVVHKASMTQKKPEKFAHNPLDSTSPLVKKGKQREVPKPKKPTALKKVILKEREERKQRRLMEERGETAEEPEEGSDEGEESVTNNTEECASLTQEPEEQPNVHDPNLSQGEENGSCSFNKVKIHSRRFRDYCSQMLSRDVDDCVTTLLKELVRFQDRLYQKDPMKARMKRRIVMGLREVLKHLKLRKLKCVIISPNCERIESKGGLDEALHSIIDTCREQEVPFVFALKRKTLGRCVNKAVPVSVVGIFNYDGAQDFYHQMIALSSEARTAYEVMLSSLEAEMEESPQNKETETEIVVGCQAEELELQIKSQDEEEDLRPNIPSLEEPEYMKLWREMMKNHREMLSLDQNCEQSTEVKEENSSLL